MLAEYLLLKTAQGNAEADSFQSGEARAELREQCKQARKTRSRNEETQDE